MKRIHLAALRAFSFPVDTREVRAMLDNLPPGQKIVPLGTIDFAEAGNDQKTALANSMEIIYALAEIESRLGDVIDRFLFGSSDTREAARSLFREHVLNKNLASYEARRKLVSHIAEETEGLSDQDLSEFRTVAGRLGVYRNSLAHGRIEYRADSGCVLIDPAGRRAPVALSDQYWAEAEQSVLTVRKHLDQIEEGIGTDAG